MGGGEGESEREGWCEGIERRRERKEGGRDRSERDDGRIGLRTHFSFDEGGKALYQVL